MSSGIETLSFDSLVAEQAVVQAEKFQGRLLTQYDNYFFPGQNWPQPVGCATADFVKPIIGHNGRATLGGVLLGMSEKQEDQLHWVDMGGGRGLAMRQSNSMAGYGQKIHTSNVDLFDYGLDGLDNDELEYLECLSPGITNPDTKPNVILDNVETVQLAKPADIITSVEAIQYLNNPLQAIANWYNQLTDNGMMFVATEHDWASRVRYNVDSKTDRYETPLGHVIAELEQNSINYAAVVEVDWENGHRPKLDPNHIRIMAIQKSPGTMLRVTKPVTDIWLGDHNYKGAYYDAPSGQSAPIIEVVSVDTAPALGAITVANSDVNNSGLYGQL
jgi:hypothetical protein